MMKKIFSLCFMFCALFSITTGHTAELKVVVFDVGMGQSVLLAEEGHGLLIDTGLAEYGPHVLSRMNFYGVRELDYLVLSHLHPDHAGGYYQIRDAWPGTVVFDNCHMAGELDLNEEESVKNIHMALMKDSLHRCLAAGDSIHWQGHELRVLWPVATKSPNINRNSLVLLLKTGEGASLLFMGDVDKTVEQSLQTTLEELLDLSGLTLFVAAHHAAADSTDPNFLSVLQPQVSVVSVGKNNPYGYPSDKSLAVLEKYSDTVLRTDREGEICYTLDTATAHPCEL